MRCPRLQLGTPACACWLELVSLTRVSDHAGNWEDALSLGLDFFEGKAKTAEGLPADQNMMRQVVADHMIEVVETYLDQSLSKDGGEAMALYRKCCGAGPVCPRAATAAPAPAHTSPTWAASARG